MLRLDGDAREEGEGAGEVHTGMCGRGIGCAVETVRVEASNHPPRAGFVIPRSEQGSRSHLSSACTRVEVSDDALGMGRASCWD